MGKQGHDARTERQQRVFHRVERCQQQRDKRLAGQSNGIAEQRQIGQGRGMSVKRAMLKEQMDGRTA